MGLHSEKHAAGVVRRHHADDDGGIAQRLFEAIGGDDGGRDGAVCQEEFVDVPGVNTLADFGFVRPEADLVAAAASEDDGHSGAPSSSSDDGDAAHAPPALVPANRFSLPASRRRMLSLWRTMMSRDEAAMSTITIGLRVSGLSHQAAGGKTAAPTMLPSET